MCGNVWVKRKDGVAAYKSVLKRYRAQKERGTSGYGYVAIQDNKVVSYQRAETEEEIIALLCKEKAPEIMFHHRQPTGTPNMVELAHPFFVEDSMLDCTYYVQHNGVIRNTNDLKEKHDKLGIEYTSEMQKAFISKKGEINTTAITWNDSESLAIETALVIDGKKAKIATEGPAAVMGLQVKEGKVINRFFYRNNLNPLKIEEDKVMFSITSGGHGETVLPALVYRIKEDNGYELFPGRIETPPSYKGANDYDFSAYGKRDKDKERRDAVPSERGHWDSELKVWVPKDSTHTRHIPGAGAGYLRDTMRHISTSLGLPAPMESDLDFRSPEEIADQEHDNEIWEIQALLNSMDINELWAEHSLSVDKEKEIKADIAALDEAVKEKITLEDLTRKEELETELEQIGKWLDHILDEVNNRAEYEAHNSSQMNLDDVQERLGK